MVGRRARRPLQIGFLTDAKKRWMLASTSFGVIEGLGLFLLDFSEVNSCACACNYNDCCNYNHCYGYAAIFFLSDVQAALTGASLVSFLLAGGITVVTDLPVAVCIILVNAPRVAFCCDNFAVGYLSATVYTVGIASVAILSTGGVLLVLYLGVLVAGGCNLCAFGSHCLLS